MDMALLEVTFPVFTLSLLLVLDAQCLELLALLIFFSCQRLKQIDEEDFVPTKR